MSSDSAAVAVQLEAIAERIVSLMRREDANLSVSAAGGDDVSRRVAGALNRRAEEFIRSVDRGADEIRLLASALRAMGVEER
ncbi:PE family protein [Mycolicibacterium rutilum]|uniref:PE family protein n=1 Tax=Mycolicibacterium rutilum TaxID=370526 RepID=A0A1H6ILX6_MYCRU|nr:PE domain-containing protein [Mycolicibacterium rutilum]SEH50610.1 PE family protein [Mycolicibacterium rutilum]